MVMTSPRSVRFDDSTVDKLAVFAARRTGMSSSSAAALLVEEGLRMDAHPGVVFQDGPSGRRAVLMAGPDVWEVIRALRDARANEPDLSPDEIMELVGDNADIALSDVHAALGYYGEHPEEIDDSIAEAEEAEARAQRALERTVGLLGV
ncbi:MAG: hypothetical protein H6524_05505 [Actinobacteria bacterium]|nr:hypothetical protein [Actinomycetota bacterium]MCB9428249.1 hypothetical protein [Actinomycetota bacterium]